MNRLHTFTAIVSVLMLMLALSFPSETHAQQQNIASSDLFGLEPGPYSVGFQLLEEHDGSRLVTGGIASTPLPRPVRIYLWYPSEETLERMRFGRYAALADGDVWPVEIAGDLAGIMKFSREPLARSLDPESLAALLQRPVAAAEDAQPLPGPFPLIVIGQGLYYESPITFAALGEYLAGRGFVVATAPLVGTNSPIVRTDAQDLETQVRDLEFVIARARSFAFVSSEKLGVLGFDQGGMAGVVLTMRNRDVDAFVSLDSGILYPHPSGLPQSSPSYDVSALRVPWLHATPPRGTAAPPGVSVESLFDTAVHSDRYLLITDEMGHVDFTSYALIDGRRAMPNYWAEAAPEGAANHRIVATYVYNFFAAFLHRDGESSTFLSRDTKEAFPGSHMTLNHRTATPSSMTYDELVQSIVKGRADEAVERLRTTTKAEPNPAALDEAHMERLAASLIYTWGLAKETLPLLEFTAERYPSSPQAQGMLAEGYILVEDYPAAIEVLSKYVQQHPDAAGAKARLEQVQKLSSAATH